MRTKYICKMGKHSIKFRESGQDIEIIFEFVVDNKKRKIKSAAFDWFGPGFEAVWTK